MNKRHIFLQLAFLLFLLFFKESGAILILLILLFWGLSKPTNALITLHASFSLYLLNPGIFGSLLSNSYLQTIRLVLILIYFIYAIFITNNLLQSKLISRLLIFLIGVILLSVVNSQIISISIFKIIYFTLGVTTLVLLTLHSKDDYNSIISWFQSFFVIVIFSSFVVYIARSSVGYLRNGDGFQGIVNHPQTFSVFLSLAIAFIIGRIFETDKNKVILYITLLMAVFLMIESKGRVGFSSLALTTLTLVFLILFRKDLRTIFSKKANSQFTLIIIFLVPILFIFSIDYIESILESVINKRYDTLEESLRNIRSGQVSEIFHNINNNPWGGIGFGIPSSESSLSLIKRDPFFGIPIGLPTEKGFLPLAVQEEIGAIGSILFLPFFYFIIREILSGQSISVVLMAICCIFTNLGEMTFFSFNGIGLFIWLIIAIAVSKNSKPKLNGFHGTTI